MYSDKKVLTDDGTFANGRCEQLINSPHGQRHTMTYLPEAIQRAILCAGRFIAMNRHIAGLVVVCQTNPENSWQSIGLFFRLLNRYIVGGGLTT